MSETELGTIRHYYRYSPALASAGQPEEAQLALLPGRFDCVINLARTDSPHALADEAAAVAALDLEYHPIPVDFRHPSPADLDDFFDVMRTHAGQRVFVHCALNWRASAFVFLHRVINEHCDPVAAGNDMHAIWQPDAVWRRFIDEMLQRHGSDRG